MLEAVPAKGCGTVRRQSAAWRGDRADTELAVGPHASQQNPAWAGWKPPGSYGAGQYKLQVQLPGGPSLLSGDSHTGLGSGVVSQPTALPGQPQMQGAPLNKWFLLAQHMLPHRETRGFSNC